MYRVFLRILLALISSLGLLVASNVTMAAPLPTAISSQSVVMPAIPSASASTATWQAWASAQMKAVESEPWAQIAATAGCTVDNVTFVPVTSSGITETGIPAGITTVAVAVAQTCASTEDAHIALDAIANASLTNANSSDVAVPETTSLTCDDNVETYGSNCIFPTDLSGGYIQVNSQFSWSGSGYYDINGHLEIGGVGVGNPCAVGAKAIDGNQYELGPQGVNVIDLAYDETILADNQWSSTFWYGPVDGSYSDWSTVCGTY